MDHRGRFQSMVDGLKADGRVRILKVTFGGPAPDAEVEEARGRAGGALPAGLEELCRQMNGFHLEWEHTVEEVRDGNDTDRGFIDLVPLGRIFGDWRGDTWFEDAPQGDRFRSVRPFDTFVPEACAAFVQPPGEPVKPTVWFHSYGETLEDTGYAFPEYLDRLLASRGLFYWLLTLCPGRQKSPDVASFRRKMPRLFDDYDDALFQPKG